MRLLIGLVLSQFLMTFYLFLGDRHGTSSGSRWTIMGIAVKLAQSVSDPVLCMMFILTVI